MPSVVKCDSVLFNSCIAQSLVLRQFCPTATKFQEFFLKKYCVEPFEFFAEVRKLPTHSQLIR